ncbi:cation-dependent mannose-6-phosphate receptor-like [Lytechinus pictus]|uniref:cation-dependent mannose-6-phosphate receptor-like n=1 Tax=Lytechinus pictus TaxID=7653 RepID=UPI0030BA04BB
MDRQRSSWMIMSSFTPFQHGSLRNLHYTSCRIKAIILILLSVSTKIINAAEITCTKETNCRCTLSDNSLYYDLEPMVTGVPPPFFNKYVTNVTYLYDPCRSFSETGVLSECTDAALCSERLGDIYQNLGIHSTSEFHYTPDGGSVKLKLVYHNGKSGAYQINSTVWLTCRTNGISYLELKSYSPTYYLFELFSPFACPKPVPPSSSLSAGGILCILFVVFVTVYFVGGFIYLFFFKYESGTNAIPHHEFWSSLPGLIKDGFLFLISCGHSNKMQSSGPQYDQI